jgi:hypothetical protein
MTAQALLAKSLAFVCIVALSGLAVAFFDQFEDVDGVGAKLEHIRGHQSDYNILFFGSSRVALEFSPSDFDAEMARRGITTKSFNFGIQGMRPPESYFLIDRVLDERPPALTLVLVEFDNYIFTVPEAWRHTRRDRYWRTPGMTARLVRATTVSKGPIAVKAEQIGYQLDECGRNALSVGMGVTYVRRLLGIPEAPSSSSLGSRGDGYEGFYESTDDAALLERHRQFLEGEQALFLKKAASVKKWVGREWVGKTLREPQVSIDHLLATLARIRAMGARPILVTMPPRTDSNHQLALHDLERRGIVTDVLSFDDPNRYPQFYDPANLYDSSHLDGEASEEFSRILAERVAELVSDGQ